ncbi:hypothetical protein GCM10009557_94280 [Virgisporangium ochraceum]
MSRGVADPERFGWRGAVAAVLAGALPGASAYTSVRWDEFARFTGSEGPLEPTLAKSYMAVTAPVVFGLAVGWAVVMVTAAFAGRAAGAVAGRSGRRWLHRAGVVLLAVAGAVLFRFMIDEREHLKYEQVHIGDDEGWLGPATAVWRNTVAGVHPAVVLGALLVLTAAAYGVVRARQSQIRSGGS